MKYNKLDEVEKELYHDHLLSDAHREYGANLASIGSESEIVVHTILRHIRHIIMCLYNTCFFLFTANT